MTAGCDILFCMTKLLEPAMAKVAALPPETQERIGGELLAHVEKVNALRGALRRASISSTKGREENST